MDEPSREELEAAHCWEADDRVPGRPEMTAFRRRARLHHARWREARGLPIGSQPLRPQPGKPSRPVGSRLPLDVARETGAGFVTPAALDAVRARLSVTEPQQSFDASRCWADLLSSPALAFNLFGDLAADLRRADRAVHAWWPDTPGTVVDVLFAHSPGRLDLAYTGSLVAFDAAFVLDLGDGTLGVVGVECRYHDRTKREEAKPRRFDRYREVADRSGAFTPEAAESLRRSDLLVLWLGHLLVHSMLQHPLGEWGWGRHVLVRAAGNTDQADADRRYRELLVDPSSFASTTVEELLAARVHPRSSLTALRDRYVVV